MRNEPLNKRTEYVLNCAKAADTMLDTTRAIHTDTLSNINDCCITGYKQMIPEMNDLVRYAISTVESSKLLRSVVEDNVKAYKAFITKWQTKLATED